MKTKHKRKYRKPHYSFVTSYAHTGYAFHVEDLGANTCAVDIVSRQAMGPTSGSLEEPAAAAQC